MIPWATLRLWDLNTGHALQSEQFVAALAEYRATGGMVDVVFIHVGHGATPEEIDNASYAGPDVSEIDWTGFEARS